MENRNEMDFNPYDWTKIKNDTPLLSKLWSVLKYHIKDNKTFSVKLETLHYVLCPLWHKFFTYYHGDQLVFWHWSKFKFQKYDRYEELEKNAAGDFILGECFECVDTYEKYPWHKNWTLVEHWKDELSEFDIWDLQEAEQYDRELSYIPAMMEDSYELN